MDAGRRQSERIRCVLKAEYRTPGHPVCLTETRDMSDGGLLMLVSGDVHRGDILDLQLPLEEGEKPITVRGRVVHLRKAPEDNKGENLAGIAFLDLDRKQRDAIGRRIWRQILGECTRFGSPD